MQRVLFLVYLELGFWSSSRVSEITIEKKKKKLSLDGQHYVGNIEHVLLLRSILEIIIIVIATDIL